ncbi:MAG: PD-(D/E)XK nuclease family protein [Baekduia sp.]
MATFAKSIERFPTLRQSRLATFDRCALSSFFEEEYLSGWSTHAQARGTIFHRFAAKALTAMYEHRVQKGETPPPGWEAAHDDAWPNGKIPTSEAVAILDECLRQADIDQRCPTPKCGQAIVKRKNGRIICPKGHDHRSDFVNLPIDQIKDLRWVVVKWAHDNTFDIDNLVDVEERLLAPISYPDPETGEIIHRQLTGQLDALFVTGEFNEHFIVLDWKDTWGLPGPTAVGFDGYFQQRMYALLVFANFPSAQQVTLREHYVRFSEYREATIFRADIDDVRAELAALAERFDRAHTESNFPPTPGQHCQFCPRPASCPIFPGVRAEGVIQDDAQAARVAREVTVAEQMLKDRKAALSAYTSVHGPQEVSSHKGRRVWGHKVIKRVGRPSKTKMEEALAAARAGVPLDLDRLYRETQGTRFELHAPQEHEDVEPIATDAGLMDALEASLKVKS